MHGESHHCYLSNVIKDRFKDADCNSTIVHNYQCEEKVNLEYTDNSITQLSHQPRSVLEWMLCCLSNTSRIKLIIIHISVNEKS